MDIEKIVAWLVLTLLVFLPVAAGIWIIGGFLGLVGSGLVIACAIALAWAVAVVTDMRGMGW